MRGERALHRAESCVAHGARGESALRTPPAGEEAPVVLAASDPSNPYTLPLAAGTSPDPLARPRGAGALLVTRLGRIVLVAEGRGTKLRVAEGATPAEVRDGAKALAERLVARQRRGRMRDLVVETVDGERAVSSRWAEALREAGYRGMGTGLRYYAGVYISIYILYCDRPIRRAATGGGA
jgi:ATP-dependent Lhr-like helicase